MLAPLYAVQTRARSPALRAAADAARDLSDPRLPVAQTTARLTETLMHWAGTLAMSPAQSLLVSCEDFSGHMPGRFGVPDYRAALPVTAAIRAALRHHLPQHRLIFLFTTRDPASWLRAVHWQLSKHDDLTQGAPRFARSHARAADFVSLLAALRAALPDTAVRDADLASLAPRRLGPVEAISDAAALPPALRHTLPPPPHSNQTPPHDLARVFVKLNRSDLPRAEVRRLKRAMLAAEDLLLGDGDLFAGPGP